MPINVMCDDCGEEISCWPYHHQYTEKDEEGIEQYGFQINLNPGVVICSECMMLRVAKIALKRLEDRAFSDKFQITLTLPTMDPKGEKSLTFRDQAGEIIAEIVGFKG